MGTIYCLTSRTSGKSYVGQTAKGIRVRYGLSTVQAARRSHGALRRAIQKYGWEDFQKLTLEEHGDQGELDEAEQFWIVLLGTKAPNGYNLSDGGAGRSGHQISEEHKRKIGGANRGRVYSPEVLARMSEGQRRRFEDPAEREKSGARFRGCVGPNLGRKFSAESRARMRAAKLGKPLSAEHRRKLSEAHQRHLAKKEHP